MVRVWHHKASLRRAIADVDLFEFDEGYQELAMTLSDVWIFSFGLDLRGEPNFFQFAPHTPWPCLATVTYFSEVGNAIPLNLAVEYQDFAAQVDRIDIVERPIPINIWPQAAMNRLGEFFASDYVSFDDLLFTIHYIWHNGVPILPRGGIAINTCCPGHIVAFYDDLDQMMIEIEEDPDPFRILYLTRQVMIMSPADFEEQLAAPQGGGNGGGIGHQGLGQGHWQWQHGDESDAESGLSFEQQQARRNMARCDVVDAQPTRIRLQTDGATTGDLLDLLESGPYPDWGTKDDAGRAKLGCILSFITYLIKFRKLQFGQYSSVGEADIPPVLFRRFSDLFIVPDTGLINSDLLRFYVLVLCLIVDDFRTDCHLGLPHQLVKSYGTDDIRGLFGPLGCQLSQREVGHTIYAELRTPLKFPKRGFAGLREAMERRRSQPKDSKNIEQVRKRMRDVLRLNETTQPRPSASSTVWPDIGSSFQNFAAKLLPETLSQAAVDVVCQQLYARREFSKLLWVGEGFDEVMQLREEGLESRDLESSKEDTDAAQILP